MTASGFDELADLALRKAGHAFKLKQRYLLDARLSEIMRRENFTELSELADCLRARPNPAFEDEVVSAMLNKQTRFFDDRQVLKSIVYDVLPAIAKSQDEQGASAPMKVWCAGGGSGQEAYSLAILIDEAGGDEFLGRPIEIGSTDICKRTTDRAISGIYDHYEIQLGLSAARMLQYFDKNDDGWRAKPALSERVNFETRNLLEPFDSYDQFDVILCRNVLGDFLSPIANDILGKLASVLISNGVLILGKDENLPLDSPFRRSETISGGWRHNPRSNGAAAVA